MLHVHHHKPKTSVYLLLLSIILIWGLVWPVCKVGLDYITPLWFVALRLIISVACMFPIVALIGKLTLPKKRDFPMIFVIGIFQIGLFLALLTVGLLYVGPGRAAILVYSTPIWVTPVAFFFFGEKLTKLKALGIFLGVAGIITILSPWGMDWTNKNVIIGNILLILSAVSWAVAMLCTRYLPWHSSSIEMSPWQLLLAAIPMVILAAIFEPHAHITWNLSLYGALVFTSFLATAFAFWALVYVTRELPVTTTAVSMLGVPLVSVIASALLLGEAFTMNNLIAMALILVGLICAAVGDGKASKKNGSAAPSLVKPINGEA